MTVTSPQTYSGRFRPPKALPLMLLQLGLVLCFSGTPSGIVIAQASLDEQSIAPSGATELECTLRTENLSTRVGQPIPVELSLELPMSSELVSLRLIDAPWVELSRTLLPETTSGSFALTLEVVTYRPGNYPIGGIEFTLLSSTGETTRVVRPGFELQVSSVIANETNPEPVPSNEPLPIITHDWRVISVLSILALLSLGALLYWLRERLRGVAQAPEEEPEITPAWQLALQGLEALELQVAANEAFSLDDWYLLSEILRAYIGDVWGFDGLESTTSEIRSQLASLHERVGEYRQPILHLLDEMDLIKFARQPTTLQQGISGLQLTRELVMDLSAGERARADDSEDPVPAYPTLEHPSQETEVPSSGPMTEAEFMRASSQEFMEPKRGEVISLSSRQPAPEEEP